MVRAVLIGAGWSANTIATAARESRTIEIAGIANHHVDKARALADKHGIPAVTGDYRDLLARKDVDLAIISLPHFLHHDVAIEAIEAGKHVLVEKPLATSVKDAEDVIARAGRGGVKIGAYFQNRYNESTSLAMDAISDGSFGRPLQASASAFFKRDPEYFPNDGWRGKINMEGGGVLLNQAIHQIDLLLYLLHANGEEVLARGFIATLVHPIETEDTAVAAFTLGNHASMAGVMGTIKASIGTKHPSFWDVTISGTGRAVSVSTDTFKIHENGNTTTTDCTVMAKQAGINTKMLSHVRLLADFCKGITMDDHEPRVSGKQCIGALRVIEGLYKHAMEHRTR